MKHFTIQFRKYHVTSPRISRQWSFLVPCHYRDSEIMEPKNRLPRTSSALAIKLYLLKDFTCPNSQEVEQFIWLELQLYVKLKRSFASASHHVVTIPNCILLYVQCSLGRIWEVYFRYKVILTQMEVDFDTHLKSIWQKLKSIWYKLRSFHGKSEEISHESLSMFASHMISIDRKNVIPEGEKSRLSGGLATFSGVSLSSCAGGQWGFSAGHFLFFLRKKVRREDENSRPNWWLSLVHSQSICPVPSP